MSKVTTLEQLKAHATKSARYIAAALGVVSAKADKVESATEGNFAALDAEGNLTDSGKKPSDIPIITFGTTAITAGSASDEQEGALHFVIE